MAAHDAAGDYPRSLTAKLANVHWPMLLGLCVIACVGFACLYSVAGGAFAPWAETQVLRFLVGMAVLLVIAMLPLGFWLAFAYPVYAAGLLLLALVPLIGVEALGARRWLDIGPLTIQPSEIMKVALGLALARYYQWLAPEKVSHPFWLLIPLIMIAAPVVLTLRQPDLGTSVLFASVGLGIMFFAGVSIWYFVGGVIAVAVAAPLIYANLHEYQRRRIEIFLNPDADPLGSGYHITQSKIALGAGGFKGRGFMQGTQSQLDFLPEKHTDFVFTVFAEEWGFIGAVSLLVLYALLLMLIAAMALAAHSRFARLLCVGAGLTVFIYCTINVAMVTGLVPVVGVPLPLISYGGTSMMTLLIGLGLAMCAYVHRRQRLRRHEIGALW